MNYCAIANFRVYHDRPFKIRVTAIKTGRSVICVVRDKCWACQRDGVGGRVVDLSPALFRKLRRLSAGVIQVRIERIWEGEAQ